MNIRSLSTGRASGGVFEVTQNRFDFGPDGIREEEISRPNRDPKKVIGGEPINISRIRQRGPVCRNILRVIEKGGRR